MKKAALIIMVLTIFVKLSGFIRDIVLSYYYGASNITDAYLISLTIPSFIFAFLSVSVTTGFIPIYSAVENKLGFKEGVRFTNNLLNIFMVISTLIVILGLIFTDKVVKIFASGFSGETLIMAITFTKWSIIGVYFSAIMSIFRGYLQVKNNFAITSLIALPNNLLILASIYLSVVFENLLILGIGTLIGALSQVIILLPNMLKEKFKYTLLFDFKDDFLKKFGVIAFPVILGVSINEINVLIDRTLASRIVEGGISALDYSFKLTQFINGSFAAAIAIAMYPLISRLIIEKNNRKFMNTIVESINMISIIVIPITVITMLFSKEIITLLYARGAFDADAINLTASTLFFYSIGILAYGYREILTRAFYAKSNSITPMLSASISMVINIILNLILSRYMGISGLALATSISGTIGSLLLIINFRNKIMELDLKSILRVTFKVSIVSLFSGILMVNLNNFLVDILGLFLSFLIALIITIIFYFIIIFLMKIEEVKSIMFFVKRKIKKNA